MHPHKGKPKAARAGLSSAASLSSTPCLAATVEKQRQDARVAARPETWPNHSSQLHQPQAKRTLQPPVPAERGLSARPRVPANTQVVCEVTSAGRGVTRSWENPGARS